MDSHEITDGAADKYLREAFLKFNQASERLQEKYQELARETEELREQLKAKDREVKRAETLATLGETAAAMAHEVRNPLGAIKLFLSLLTQDLQDRPESLEMLSQISKSVSSIDNVVSNILCFSKEKKAVHCPLSLNSIVQIAEFRRIYPRLQVQADLEANPFMLGNEHSLRQMIHNLLLNAAQATKGEGRVAISSVDADEFIEICITDDGPGLPPHLVEEIFEPFVTTKNEGTGLGLAIVRQIASQHGGTIGASNAGGASFKVRLARMPARQAEVR
jgi:two-component system, NtrC family, sensor histidine kinase HydH